MRMTICPVATLLEYSITCGSPMVPLFESSQIWLPYIIMQPGAVWKMLCIVITWSCSAAAMVKGFITDPGS